MRRRWRLVSERSGETMRVDTEHGEIVLPAKEAVGGVEDLRGRRTVDKSLDAQRGRRVFAAELRRLPLALLRDMQDHTNCFSTSARGSSTRTKSWKLK